MSISGKSRKPRRLVPTIVVRGPSSDEDQDEEIDRNLLFGGMENSGFEKEDPPIEIQISEGG